MNDDGILTRELELGWERLASCKNLVLYISPPGILENATIILINNSHKIKSLHLSRAKVSQYE